MKRKVAVFLAASIMMSITAFGTQVYTNEENDLKAAEDAIRIEDMETESTEVTQEDIITGGWMDSVDEETAAAAVSALEKALEGMTGAVYEPIEVIASQIVAGTNYTILCKVTTVTLEPSITYELVTVYEDLDGHAEITDMSEVEGSDYASVLETESADETASDVSEEMALDGVLSEKMLTEVSAGTLPQIVTTRKYKGEWNDEYQTQLAWASWDNVELMNGDAYGALDQALSSLAKSVDMASEQQYDAALTYAKDDLDAGMDAEYFAPGTYSSEIRIRRADQQVVSFLMENYAFNRGPHGSTWYQGQNFRSDTGERLTLDDLVRDKAGLMAVLRTNLQEKYPDLNAFQAEPDYDYWGDILPVNLVWTVEADTVTFWFEAGKLGIYAEGEQVVSIAYSEYPDLFTEEFVTSPETAVCEITDGEEIRLDVNGDGSLDTVQLQANWGEYSSIESITVQVNDVSYTQDTYGYSVSGVVLHQEAGTYLLAEVGSDNDYRQNLIFRLTDGEPIFVTTAEYGMLTWYAEDDQILHTEHITDPSDFRWQARTDMLGTTSVFGRFYLDENGTPVCMHEDLYYCYDRVLTTRQTIDGDEVRFDEDAAVLTGNTAELAAGAKVRLIGTDNASYVDLQGEDETCLRIPVDMSEYPASSNGVDVEELFAGILYAG